MRKNRNGVLLFIFILILIFPELLPSSEEQEILALKGAKVHTAASPPIPSAVVLIREGKILEVGSKVAIPQGATIIDLEGKEIIPGLIDEHSHIGSYFDVNEFTQPLGPENRALDALNLDDEDWYEALKGGVTTVVTGPGSGERMGGQSVTIKTWGKDPLQRILKESREAKMAVNARDLSHIPSIRKMFYKALEYKDKWEKYEASEKKGAPPEKDLALEALVPVLEGKEKLRLHVHFANDMLTFLRLKDEFGFDLTFIHSSEAYKIAREIAKRKVPVITLPLATRIPVCDEMLLGIKELFEAGVKVSLHTDHPVVHQKLLRLNAGMAIRYGVPEEEALKMVTLNPAQSSKINSRVGSIEKGKDADLVVLNGVWYQPRTRVEMVFVDGTLAYDRANEEKFKEERK